MSKPLPKFLQVFAYLLLMAALLWFTVTSAGFLSRAINPPPDTTLLYQEAMTGDVAAVLAYCNALVPKTSQGGRFADCVERTRLESFVTQSARWSAE